MSDANQLGHGEFPAGVDEKMGEDPELLPGPEDRQQGVHSSSYHNLNNIIQDTNSNTSLMHLAAASTTPITTPLTSAGLLGVRQDLLGNTHNQRGLRDPMIAELLAIS
ncbi:MAG: hypothetical protein H0W21_11740 [Actinobacteria bacterium]|nr:hypothetical protein [Actinomycetota bacterium]